MTAKRTRRETRCVGEAPLGDDNPAAQTRGTAGPRRVRVSRTGLPKDAVSRANTHQHDTTSNPRPPVSH